MRRLKFEHVGSILRGSLISVGFIYPFQWHFATRESSWPWLLLWIPLLAIEFWVSSVACDFLNVRF